MKALVAIGLTGLSLVGSAAGAVASTGTAEPAGVEVAAVVQYLEALDTVDASPALAVASPRSAAWRYAEHQVAFEVARRASGSAAAADVVSPLDEGRFQTCPDARTPFCAVFGDFSADSSGRISAFTVDGVDISPRVGDPSDATAFGAVTARVRSSYRTVRSDALIVVVEVAADTGVSFAGPASYTEPSGRSAAQVDVVAPPTLPADSISTVALVFQSVDPGGRLVWELSPDAGGPVVVELAVPALLTGSELAVASEPATSPPGSPAPTPRPPSPQVVEALEVALATPLGVSGRLAEVDVGCLGKAVAALPPSTRDTIDRLATDRTLFDSMNNELARAIAVAYLGCVDDAGLIGLLAAMTTGAVQQLDCVADAWTPIVTPDAVASSVAYGSGLDDLSPDIVDRMALAAADCVPDQWWIDDEAAALVRAGLDDDQATCAATAIVDSFGVGPIIRRRILGLDLLPVSQAELDAVDLASRCDVRFPSPAQLDVTPGTCLSGFLEGPGQTRVVACNQPHNAEVVTVTDLDDEFRSWPGAQVVRELAAERCTADLEALSVDGREYAAGWDLPTRLLWEQSLRMLTCTLIRADSGHWTGATGLVPTGPPAPSTPG
jgi:hypothetical protein